MTSQQLQALDWRIRDTIQKRGPLGRLLIYSLNRDLISDADFREIKQGHFSQEELFKVPWALALFWGRLFYEDSKACDYKKILKDNLKIDPAEAFQLIHDQCGWFPKEDTILNGRLRNTYRFQTECWITSGEGHSSKLWKYLPPIIRKTDHDSSSSDICNLDVFDEDDDIIPPPILWLFNREDRDFCQTIKYLAYDHPGDALGQLISGNPIWLNKQGKDEFNCSLGIEFNGTQPEFVIRINRIWFGMNIANDSRDILISQVGTNADYQTTVSRGISTRIVKFSSLPQNFTLNQPIEVKLGSADSFTIPAINWSGDSVLLFRAGEKSDFYKFIPHNSSQHIQGCYLYIAGCPGEKNPPRILLDQTQCNLICKGHLMLNGIVRKIYRLELGDLFKGLRKLVHESNEKSISLAQIGRKPFITFNQEDIRGSDWRLEEDDVTRIIVGQQNIVLTAGNLLGENPTWNLWVNGETKHLSSNTSDQLSASIGINQVGYGNIFSVSVKTQEDKHPARIRLCFLPEPDTDALQWHLVDEDEDSRFRTAYTSGFERWKITLPTGGEIRLFKPLKECLWAWRQKLVGPRTEYNSYKQFLTHRELKDVVLELAVPRDLGWKIIFNENELTCESGSYLLGDIVRRHIGADKLTADLLDNPDLLYIISPEGEEQEISTIQRLPGHPILGVIQDEPKIYFPADASVDNYTLILCRESDLVRGKILKISIDTCNPGQIISVRGIPNPPIGGECCWLVLLKCPPISIPDTITGFASILYQLERQGEVVGMCQISKEADQNIPELIYQWSNGNRGCINEIRSTLDLLEVLFGRIPNPRGLEKLWLRARNHRAMLEVVDRAMRLAFLKNYFKDNVLRSLVSERDITTLFLTLLQCGFNWMADHQWVEDLEKNLKELLSTLQPRRRYAGEIKNHLQDCCPLVKSFLAISKGAPWNKKIPGVDLVHDDFFKDSGDIGLSVRFPTSSIPGFLNGRMYRGVSKRGLALGADKTLDYQEIKSINPTRVRDNSGPDSFMEIRLYVHDTKSATDHFEDFIQNEEVVLFSDDTAERLKKIFNSCLECSSSILGPWKTEDQACRNLGFLFKICSDRFETMALEDEGQENRAVMYQVAVISRLHALYPEGTHPQGWPLLQLADYDLVSSIAAKLWTHPSTRLSLMKDIAPIEWLLTWFKNT